ncbi:MAG: type I-C CRISPR-associated protein Cas5c [Coriobacteriia bacterium]|nr:type I-C CRISPR-associated protein Cas5c [Coriobacteriia bacterium]
MGHGIIVEVSGERACFTRPELKAERVSYDVMTPSAARGILEAIYWKPEIVWRIDAIHVLNEIKFDTFRRNEVGSKGSYTKAKSAMKTGARLAISTTDDRQQRAMTYLRDVRYVIEAHFDLVDEADNDAPAKHYNMVLRRLRKGQCFNQPYLGCREFAVGDIRLVEDGEIPRSFYEGREIDLGYMLYDFDFPLFGSGGMPEPCFFRAKMSNGKIDVATAREQVVK